MSEGANVYMGHLQVASVLGMPVHDFSNQINS